MPFNASALIQRTRNATQPRAINPNMIDTCVAGTAKPTRDLLTLVAHHLSATRNLPRYGRHHAQRTSPRTADVTAHSGRHHTQRTPPRTADVTTHSGRHRTQRTSPRTADATTHSGRHHA